MNCEAGLILYITLSTRKNLHDKIIPVKNLFKLKTEKNYVILKFWDVSFIWIVSKTNFAQFFIVRTLRNTRRDTYKISLYSRLKGYLNVAIFRFQISLIYIWIWFRSAFNSKLREILWITFLLLLIRLQKRFGIGTWTEKLKSYKALKISILFRALNFGSRQIWYYIVFYYGPFNKRMPKRQERYHTHLHISASQVFKKSSFLENKE